MDPYEIGLKIGAEFFNKHALQMRGIKRMVKTPAMNQAKRLTSSIRKGTFRPSSKGSPGSVISAGKKS